MARNRPESQRPGRAPHPVQRASGRDVATVALDISTDNVQFGVRAADRAGHRGSAAFP
jgi:hypothetical protein